MAWTLALVAAVIAAPGQSPLRPVTLEITSPLAGEGAQAAPLRGATLVLNALCEERRAALARALEDLGRVLARRRNPFFVSLDDGEERAAVQKLLAASGPATGAAAALTAAQWRSPEGDLSIRPVARCHRGARCVVLAGGPAAQDQLAARVRFLTWPLGSAVVVGLGPGSDARRVAEAVRSSSQPQAPIAMLLASDELHSLRPSAALAGIVRGAARVARALDSGPLADALKPLAGATSAGDELPWLRLPAQALLVLPRLGALAASEHFADEVQARVRAAGGQIAWLARF
jgi:hypothetical protein